nr:hypothetical protein GCM10020092_001630 [Actinoplanes digitatis]
MQGQPAKAKRGKAARQLVVTAGQLAGTRITLGEAQITIGRAEDSTLVITDDFASARHARLVPRDGQWFVEDLGSTNGTYLDRGKVSGPTPVPPLACRSGSAALHLSYGHDPDPALRRPKRPRSDPRRKPRLRLRRTAAPCRRRRHGRHGRR